jgi:hypothetical protein
VLCTAVSEAPPQALSNAHPASNMGAPASMSPREAIRIGRCLNMSTCLWTGRSRRQRLTAQ